MKLIQNLKTRKTKDEIQFKAIGPASPSEN